MIFKQIQHRYDFHAIQNYHMSINERGIEKEQGNPYLKWRTQGEEEQNSKVLQTLTFSDGKKAHTKLYTIYKVQRVGGHSY